MYNKSKDLILISFFGFIYYAIVVGLNGHLTKVPLGEYFVMPFAIACFMGMIIQRTSQIIEWPLCFLFGGTIGSVALISVLSFLGMEFTLRSIAFTVSSTFAWFGVMATLILVGILIGSFLRSTFTLVMGSLRMTLE
ncbi:MAG: hypothetical protein AAF203_08595 [Pseudomonadota bacterium]